MKTKFIDMTPSEQRIFQQSWRRIRRTLFGALINQIHCHGKISVNHIPSVMKRLTGQLREPIREMVNNLIEEKRGLEKIIEKDRRCQGDH